MCKKQHWEEECDVMQLGNEVWLLMHTFTLLHVLITHVPGKLML